MAMMVDWLSKPEFKEEMALLDHGDHADDDEDDDDDWENGDCFGEKVFSLLREWFHIWILFIRHHSHGNKQRKEIPFHNSS